MNWYWWIIAGVTVAAASFAIWWALDEEDEVVAEENNAMADEGGAMSVEKEEKSQKGQLEGAQLWNLNLEKTLTQIESQGVVIDVDGGKAYFSIEENATTGYQWMVNDGACSSDLVSINSSFDAPNAVFTTSDGQEVELLGLAGTRYFTFTGGVKGECIFEMAYARSWEFDWETNGDNYAQKIKIPVIVA